MQEIHYSELESEISRLTNAFATRNASIGRDIITHLRSRLTLRDVAGIVLVSLERLLWADQVAFCWAVENSVPIYVMREIRKITSMTVYKQLIGKGLQPGHDFSIDSKGNVILGDRAKGSIFS